MGAEEERKRKEREEKNVKLTKRERCNLCCISTLYTVVRAATRSMHLEHAKLGKAHKDPKFPASIGETRANVNRWKQRVAIQVKMGFFLNKIIRLFFWILLLAYVPVSSTIMRYYLCEPIGSKYYLVADLRVECWSKAYNDVAFTAVCGIVLYIIGIPVLFYGVLKINREENVTKLLYKMKSNENLKQRFLAMARADIEVSGQLYVTPQDEDDVAVIVGAFLRRKNLRSHKLLSQIGFIVESYQEHAWYYEMWELVRKLFLVGVIAVIAPGSVFQILIGLLVCMTATFISLILRPYKQASDGWLNNVCLAQLTFVLFLGLLLKLDVDIMGAEGSGDQTTSPADAIAWIIIFSHGTLMLISIALLIYEIKNAPSYQRAVRHAEQRKRETVRKHIETWAKGRRAALLRMAKRKQDISASSDFNDDPEFNQDPNTTALDEEKEKQDKENQRIEAQMLHAKETAENVNIKIGDMVLSSAENADEIAAMLNKRKEAMSKRIQKQRSRNKKRKGITTAHAAKVAAAKHLTDIETEHFSRQAELKQEYDNLQSELKSMANVGKESMMGAGDAAKEFLEQEKERLEKRKRNLEVQLKTIIDHHDASKDTLTKLLMVEKDRVHQRILDRKAKKLARTANFAKTVGTVGSQGRGGARTKIKPVMNTPQHTRHSAPENLQKNSRRHSHIDLQNGWKKAAELTGRTSVTHVNSMMQAIHLQQEAVEMTAELLFDMLGYYGAEGEHNVFDEQIQTFMSEHSSNHGIDVPRDFEGNTLLIAAVRYKNVAATRLLLNVGHSEPSCHNKKGNTALHYAAASGNVQIVNLLLQKNLNTTTATNNTTYMQTKDQHGVTAAGYAARNGHVALIDLLGGLNGTSQHHETKVSLPPLPKGITPPNIQMNQRKSAAPPLPQSGKVNKVGSNAAKNMNKWRTAAWIQGVRRYNQKKNANQQLRSVVALMLAKKEVQKKIQEASMLGKGSDQRLHDLEEKLILTH